MTDSSRVPTKANAQCGNRLAVSLETETKLARGKQGKCSAYKKKYGTFVV
jgi:S-ribosylhomocysteine lyase LuxS involved in autoinducer biosynthesis